MIIRIWHGKIKTSDAETYRDFIFRSGIPDYLATPGNKGAQYWQKTEGEITHVWTASWWDNLKSIEGFAGKDIEKAHYYEEDKNWLLEFEPGVVHYEVFT